jgi:hypothetical protein
MRLLFVGYLFVLSSCVMTRTHGQTGFGSTGIMMNDEGVVDEVLDMGEDAYELIESQRERDESDMKDLGDQCNQVTESIKAAIEVREKAMGRVQTYLENTIDEFKKSLDKESGKEEPLFGSIVNTLEEINKETQKTQKEWEDLKELHKAKVQDGNRQVGYLRDQMRNLRDGDSELASVAEAHISKIGATLATMTHRFEGDVPASSGFTKRDKKLDNTNQLEEFVAAGRDGQVARFRNDLETHSRRVNADLEQLRQTLKDINNACASMKNAYDDRARIVEGLLVVLGNALRKSAPEIYKSRGDRAFKEYIQSAISLHTERTSSKLAEYTAVPMSTQSEIDALEPQVAAQAVKLRNQAYDKMVESSSKMIQKRRDAQARDKIRDNALEAYDKASELLGEAKEDLRIALEGAHVGHDAIGKLVGVDLASPKEVFGATAGTFDGVKDEDEKELLNKAMKHQVGVYEIESLRTKAESLLRMQKEEADKVKEAQKESEHAHKMLQAAMQALEFKKLIWGKSQKAAEDVLQLLGVALEPKGPVPETEEDLERERADARSENARLESQVKDLQEDGRDLLGDIDVAVNHLDDIAATGGNHDPEVSSDVDEIDDLIGSYGNLRKGRDEKEEKARDSEHEQDSAVNKLTEYMSGLSTRR